MAGYNLNKKKWVKVVLLILALIMIGGPIGMLFIHLIALFA